MSLQHVLDIINSVYLRLPYTFEVVEEDFGCCCSTLWMLLQYTECWGSVSDTPFADLAEFKLALSITSAVRNATIYLSIYLSVFYILHIYSSIYPFVYLIINIYIYIYVFINISIYLSIFEHNY